MKHRAFIALLGSAAAGWPLGVLAQQAGRTPRIGFLTGQAENDPDAQTRLAAFLQALQQLGWIDGRTVRIDYRWGAGDAGLISRYAAELIVLAPDVILATGGSTMGPLQHASATVPIVFVQVPDPVGAGFVASLAQPGGNAIGFNQYEYGISAKWLGLLKQIAPGAAEQRSPPPASPLLQKTGQLFLECSQVLSRGLAECNQCLILGLRKILQGFPLLGYRLCCFRNSAIKLFIRKASVVRIGYPPPTGRC
jgi:hypothetical protein